MKDRFGMDAEFLLQPFDYVSSPLTDLPGARRLLFAPGTGLGLGDQFLCLPLLERLRRHYPGASIHLWTEFGEFWEMIGDPCVHVVPSPRQQPHALVEYARRNSFDAVVAGYYPDCLHDLAFFTCPTVFCAGTELSHYRAFFAFQGLCREIPLVHLHRRVSEQQRFLGLFDDFGLGGDAVCLPKSCNRARARATLHPEPRILVHPGAAKAYKQWPAANWRSLVKRLADRGAQVLISAGVTEGDRQLARDVQGGDERVEVLPSMGLNSFLGHMSDSDIVLSADTFIPHAAAWLGGPHTLTLYGPTDPLRFCPISETNLFLTPLAIDPVAVAGAVDTVIALRRHGPCAVAHPGATDALVHASRALVQFVTGSVGGDLPPQRAAAEWQLLVQAYRDRIHTAHRRLLVGDDAMLDRCERFAGTTPWSGALGFLRSAAALRGAMLVMRCRDRVSPAGAMAS